MERKTYPTAGELNRHLLSGGYVQVTTYYQSRLYGPQNHGDFRDCRGELHVRRGKCWDCLATPKLGPLVSIRLAAERPD